MTEIPQQLKDENFRFVLIKYKTKRPYENNWQNNGYKYNDPKLIKHLEEGGNYGVIGGYGNLRIIDIDDPTLIEEYDAKLKSFATKTGSGGRHYYILCNYNKNHVFKGGKGELRANNYQVVGPNSIHPSGIPYQVVNDIAIKEYSENELLEIIKPLLNVEENNNGCQIIVDKNYIDENILPKLTQSLVNLITNPSSKELAKAIGFNSRSERDQRVIVQLTLAGFVQYVKSIFENYPVGDKYKEHKSPEKYLEFNIKNARAYSGVTDDLYTKLEKEIENLPDSVMKNKVNEYLKKILLITDDLKQNILLGLIAKKTFISKQDLGKKINEIRKSTQKATVTSLANLEVKEFKELEYWLYPIVPKGCLVLLGGKPGMFKSMFVFAMGLSMCGNDKFLNNFEIRSNPKILLYDLENGEEVIYERLKYLKNGMENKKQLDLSRFDIMYEFNRFNAVEELERAMKYDIIIIDSYRRFLKGNENDSEITDDFWHNFLKPLKDSGKTILMIHHLRKLKIDEEMTEEDLLDAFRGSSDIPTQTDLTFGVFRLSQEMISADDKQATFTIGISRAKNRRGLAIKNFRFNVLKDNNEKKTTFGFIGYYDKVRPPTPKEEKSSKVYDFIKERKEIEKDELIEWGENNNISKASIERYLDILKREGKIHQPKYGFYKTS